MFLEISEIVLSRVLVSAFIHSGSRSSLTSRQTIKELWRSYCKAGYMYVGLVINYTSVIYLHLCNY